MIILLPLLLIIVLLIIKNIRIVPQAHAFVLERLGVYSKTWTSGLHVKVPFIERVAKRVDLREQVADFPPQPVITKDNVTMQIDTVVFFAVSDPKLYVYGIVNPISAVENLTATTLRNIIGELELDATLTSRELINEKMRVVLDEATDPWGIKVNRVELKNIMPPMAIQESMEKQMKAERERRESILRAEGEKKSAILKAEGEKESAILRADAQKIEMIKEAEGHAESIRLHREAEAQGVIRLKDAEALGVKKLLDAGLTTEDIVKIRSLEALEKAADGNASKVIIPADIQNITGFTEGVAQSIRE
ncbi:MAG: SPFH domain-containing protein [Eubacteriales bacterium]|nr:SPFH domain-containing protein [Eubacteriales bacterium]